MEVKTIFDGIFSYDDYHITCRRIQLHNVCIVLLSRCNITHCGLDSGFYSRFLDKQIKKGKVCLKPFKPPRCIKASYYITENRFNFPTTKGYRMNIYIKLIYQYMVIFVNFSTTLNHLHPLQVENCDSNSRFVVDENDNDKFRLERVKNNTMGDSFGSSSSTVTTLSNTILAR